MMSLFKIYETFHKFPSELVTNQILLEILGKIPFFVKSLFSLADPSFFCSFGLNEMPLKIVAVIPFLFYIVVPPGI